jgi:hypothetical protein
MWAKEMWKKEMKRGGRWNVGGGRWEKAGVEQ